MNKEIKCPFCETGIEKHEEGDCLDAWVFSFRGPTLKVEFKEGSDGFWDFFVNGKNMFFDNIIPKVSTDLNKAIELWQEDWELYQDGSGYWYIKKYMNLAEGKTPALAIVRAFVKSKALEKEEK